MKKIKFAVAVMLVLVTLSTGALVAKQSSEAVSGTVVLPTKARIVVKVFFYHEPGEYIDLSPVSRQVNATAPARAAIEALLKGPTAAERRRGFGSLASASEFRIGSLTIARGTARVDFVSRQGWLVGPETWPR